MKRTMAWILAMLCIVSLFGGCQGKKKELDPRGLVNELLDKAAFTDSLNELDAPVVPIVFGVDPEDYTAAIVYAGTGATAEEIAVFTAKDDAAAERLLTTLRQHVADRIESFRNYGPAAAMALEDAVVKRSGDHVIVVVCSDSASAAKIVDKYA